MLKSDPAMSPQLELRGITKEFPGCLANDQVSLRVMPGEIHALLGENGAGKSTLVKIIYGVLQADSGDVLWEGEVAEINSPNLARKLGIGMVFQHFSLFEALTVTENIVLGMENPPRPRDLEEKVREISENYGLPLDPRRHVHTLSVGERQRIEIVRCLLQNPRLLIMDEPTSVLTPQEVERLFETLRRLSQEGCSILYISHKLEEIRALCESATILRGGQVVETCDPKVESAKSMAQMMIGEELQTPEHTPTQSHGDVRLVVRDLSLAAADEFGIDLKNISFSVRSGEIYGIAGVAGNGQGELMAALSGEASADQADAVTIMGSAVGLTGPRRRRAWGAAFVPEERNGHGAVADLSLAENAYLSGYERIAMTRHGFIQMGARDAYARRVIERFDVRTRGIEAEAGSLSGGNLQKFIVGREIMQRPSVLVVAQPTWGVDAGAAAAIHQALIDLAKEGAAVIVVSQDLDEILSICDRFAVMSEGRLSDSLEPHAVSVEEIGLLMGGIHGTASVAGGDTGETDHAA